VTRPFDMPKAERWQHGVRARYVCGCRCEECRRANREYVHKRTLLNIRGHGNPLVDAAPVRRHIRKLAKAGLGRHTIADASNVRANTIHDILRGQKRHVRKQSAQRILGVTLEAIADHATVSAKKTWRRIATLLEEGFTKAELARRLGYRRPALQLGRERVLARTAFRVERLYRTAMGIVVSQ